jgi:hypothetical protein
MDRHARRRTRRDQAGRRGRRDSALSGGRRGGPECPQRRAVAPGDLRPPQHRHGHPTGVEPSPGALQGSMTDVGNEVGVDDPELRRLVAAGPPSGPSRPSREARGLAAQVRRARGLVLQGMRLPARIRPAPRLLARRAARTPRRARVAVRVMARAADPPGPPAPLAPSSTARAAGPSPAPKRGTRATSIVRRSGPGPPNANAPAGGQPRRSTCLGSDEVSGNG